MTSNYLRNAIVLGLLSAVGPFAIDMYLPALPSIASGLDASTAATQMTLTAFFLAFGVCQIVYGPLSDMVGRKPPLYFGVSLFIVGSIGCGLAPTIEWLIAFRFVQGLGASALMVSMVKLGTTSPVVLSCHSLQRPARAHGAPSARRKRHQTFDPLSQFGSSNDSAGMRQRRPSFHVSQWRIINES